MPGIVRLTSMGRSYEGRKLFIVKISDNVAVDESEREVYVDGGIHAHEHISTEQALALIHWLADGYGTDDRTTAIVDSTEIWIAPMVNPDGAMFDISGEEFHRWRKNRQPSVGTADIGTDPNRNFAYKWGGRGSSADPSDSFYRGARPWATPEARRIRDFVRSRVIGGRQQIIIALTLHSHGEFVMYPFGYTLDPLPPDMRPADLDLLRVLASGMADRNGYRALQAGQLYRSSGTFMDWALAKQRILALTLEMYPSASVDDGWYVRDEDVPPELERNRDALLWFLEQAST
jgi:carboxypeptidase T